MVAIQVSGNQQHGDTHLVSWSRPRRRLVSGRERVTPFCRGFSILLNLNKDLPESRFLCGQCRRQGVAARGPSGPLTVALLEAGHSGKHGAWPGESEFSVLGTGIGHTEGLLVAGKNFPPKRGRVWGWWVSIDALEREVESTAAALENARRALLEALDEKRNELKAIRNVTARESEVLTLVRLGHRNLSIAARLGVSERTIKYHVSNLLAKAGVGSRGQL